MRGWLKGGQPACFPLPVFFFPQGFMTGTLQTFARKYQVIIYYCNTLAAARLFRSQCLEMFSDVTTLPCSCFRNDRQNAYLSLALGEAVEAHILVASVVATRLHLFCGAAQ